MKHTVADLSPESLPQAFQEFILPGCVYDSSCSAAARVWYLDTNGGFFLKKAPKGSLRREMELTRFFHQKGLSAPVIAYESHDCDWLLTQKIPGEDCLDREYLRDPLRLCDTLGQLLRMLHETDSNGCPVPDRTAEYLRSAQSNYENRNYDLSLFPDNWGYRTPEDAWAQIEANAQYLKKDTLLHGDYCLPNILLKDWQFSGFIDLGAGGVGDRHVDLFWGAWTLNFNLKTDRYRDRFLDVYGRDRINEDVFHTIAAIEVFT